MSGRWSCARRGWGKTVRGTASRQDQRRERERAGRRAEFLAALWLRLKGYRIIEQRAKTPLGEIDLVVCKGRLLVFVEVKTRPTIEGAFLSVEAQQRRRVEEAARLWVGRRQRFSTFGWRFDVVAVAPGSRPMHLKDAWRPEIALSGRHAWPRT
jgi:putative endonuclease